MGFSTARVISRVTRIEIIMPPLHIVHSVGPAHDHSPSGADGRNSDPVFGTERDRLNCNIFDNERGGRLHGIAHQSGAGRRDRETRGVSRLEAQVCK